MTIKSLKSLTDDYRVKGVLSFFWNYCICDNYNEPNYIYRSALTEKEYLCIDEVFWDIRDIFINSINDENGYKPHRREERDELRSFSKLLFDDSHYWEKDTFFEKRRQVALEQQAIKKNNYQQLLFIYDMFGLRVKKHQKRDLVVQIACDKKLSNAIIVANESKQLTREELYLLCEYELLKGFDYNTFSWNSFIIMNSVSRLTYGESDYWAKKNSIIIGNLKIQKCRVIKTEHLVIHLSSKKEMEELIANENDNEIKTAYHEMLNNCLDNPDQWKWYAIWIIGLKDKTQIGTLSFKGLSQDGITEIGYGIVDEFQNNGYATEAVKAMVKWALKQRGVNAVMAEIDGENTASMRVLEKCDFIPTGTFGTEGPRFIRNKNDIND